MYAWMLFSVVAFQIRKRAKPKPNLVSTSIALERCIKDTTSNKSIDEFQISLIEKFVPNRIIIEENVRDEAQHDFNISRG